MTINSGFPRLQCEVTIRYFDNGSTMIEYHWNDPQLRDPRPFLIELAGPGVHVFNPVNGLFLALSKERPLIDGELAGS